MLAASLYTTRQILDEHKLLINCQSFSLLKYVAKHGMIHKVPPL